MIVERLKDLDYVKMESYKPLRISWCPKIKRFRPSQNGLMFRQLHWYHCLSLNQFIQGFVWLYGCIVGHRGLAGLAAKSKDWRLTLLFGFSIKAELHMLSGHGLQHDVWTQSRRDWMLWVNYFVTTLPPSMNVKSQNICE